MDFHTIFNEKLDEFLKDIINGFPKTQEYENIIAEFKTLKSGVNLMKNVDSTKPQEFFREYIVAKYRDIIIKEDEQFFLAQEDYNIVSKRMEYWMDFINKIKKAWRQMDNNTRVIIWKYFKVLIILSDKCDAAKSK